MTRLAFLSLLVLAAAQSSAALAQGARRDDGEAAAPQKQPTLTRPPVVLEAVTPTYPREAIDAGVEGSVGVRITIDATGAVTEVVVTRPLGHGLDEAAVAAARLYRFRPAELDGVAAAITVDTAIHFVLDKSEPEPEPAAPPDSKSGRSTVSGVVLDRDSGDPVPGAVVSIGGREAHADDRGAFSIDALAAGSHAIVAQAPGFAVFRRGLKVGDSEELAVELHLRPEEATVYQTLVEAERERLEVTRRTIGRREMTTVRGTFGDPIRVVQALPGMARSPFSTGFLLIRGSNPGDSGVYVDGHEVPLLFHLAGGPSFLNPEFLGEINLYPGGFPARFGRATGGVVAVESRTPPSDAVHGSADVDLFDAGAYFGTPIGERASLAVAARQSYINLMLPLFIPEPDEGETLIVTPVYRDYNLRADVDLGRHGSLTGFVLGSADRLDLLSEDAERQRSASLGSDVDFFRAIVSYKRPLAGGLELTLSTAAGRDSVKLDASDQPSNAPTTRVGAAQDVIGTRLRVAGQVSDRVRVDSGIDFDSRRNKIDLRVPIADDVRGFEGMDLPVEDIEFHADEIAIAAHGEAALKVTDALTLIGGARVDGWVLNGQTRASVDPRLVARYRLTRALTLKGYGGLFHQSSAAETYDPRFGNPDLELERAIHAGVGAEYKLADHWTVDAEAYAIDRDNLVALDEAARYANSGDGRTVGAELMIKRQVTDDLYGWLSYTVSKTERRERPMDPYGPTPFDQTHVLNAVASYRIGGWELGARFRLATGIPETPVVGSTFDSDANRYRPVDGEVGSERRKTYHQLDLRVEKNWRFDTWGVGVYLDVQNALDVDNVEATQYDYRFRDSAPITGIPIVPTLGVKGKF